MRSSILGSWSNFDDTSRLSAPSTRQGSEKTAIVISLVRSNAEGNIGFLGRPLDGSRRLNAAKMSAKRFCVLVGNWHTLRSWKRCVAKDAELYEDFYSYLDDSGRMHRLELHFIPVPKYA